MGKTSNELTTEIVVSLHEELYQDYRSKCYDDDYSKDFGDYVGEQLKLIRNALKE